MGMYITFYKIVSDEEYKNPVKGVCYRELTYTSNLGDIKRHMYVSTVDDEKVAFQNLGLDYLDYEFQSCGRTILYAKLNFINTQEDYDALVMDKQFKIINLENRNLVEFDYDNFPRYTKITYKYYVKNVYNKKVSWEFDEDIFIELERIQTLLNNRDITKARFEELLYHIPKFKYIIDDYYNIPKDLDFDIFKIDW